MGLTSHLNHVFLISGAKTVLKHPIPPHSLSSKRVFFPPFFIAEKFRLKLGRVGKHAKFKTSEREINKQRKQKKAFFSSRPYSVNIVRPSARNDRWGWPYKSAGRSFKSFEIKPRSDTINIRGHSYVRSTHYGPHKWTSLQFPETCRTNVNFGHNLINYNPITLFFQKKS